MKKKSKRKLMRRALDRKDIVMNRIQLSYETLDYLEKLFSEIKSKEEAGVEYSEKEWDCLTAKCAWEERLLDSYETEMEAIISMVKQATNKK